jgi:ATP-dependent exoDNAse (exonuclease V) beta subunit
MQNLSAWKEGSAVLTYNRREYEVSPDIQKAAAALVEHLIHETREYRLREASAVRLFLGHYHDAYEQEVRGRGLLTFSDVTALLQPSGDFRGMTQAPPEGLSARLQLDERLDSRYDHWLLDEFQDTSRSQYLALHNLLDEVIMEAGGTHGQRSFFCVGDVKQAIYGWRKGDSRLFDEIFMKANGGIRRDHLSSSWRSSAEVLDALNKVFGSLDETAPGIDELVRARWDVAWADHAPAEASNPLPGYVSWVSSEADDVKERDSEIRDHVVVLLRDHLVKIRSGAISAAILVRSNKEASRWVDILREEGIPALSESNPPVGRDNPVASVIHSVITLMAHPGDGFARGHLSMAPLGGIFFKDHRGSAGLSEFLDTTGRLKSQGGFSALTEWALGLIGTLIRDPFSKDRSSALMRAALKADEAGITDPDEFLQMLEEYEEPGRSAPRSVQVMTIHKSKGLEYDMVVIPVTGKMMSLESTRNDDITGWENESGEAFVMKLPPEDIRLLPENITLQIAADKHRLDQLFESLCAWYVAMSRAKSALYLFTHEPKKPKKGADPACPSFPGLVLGGLDEHRSWGDPDWADHLKPKEQSEDPDPLPSRIELPARVRSLRKETPSGHHDGALLGEAAFSPRDAAALGTEVHELFESIDWIDPRSPWVPPEGYSEESIELVRACIARGGFRELFTAPEGSVEIWKEKRFDMVVDDPEEKGDPLWLSGCFDRVVIHRDAKGKALRAELIDYKTDLNKSREQLIGDHGEQLRIYRRVLHRLLGLQEEHITLRLIHVRESDPVVPVG